MVLLEREGFLAELSTLLQQVQDRNGRLLFLGGEAGIGKSELLKTFIRDADAEVLLGACDSLSTPRPLSPLHDMAFGNGIGLDRHDLTSKPRDEIFDAFLEHLSGTKEPKIVIFEDVHWADEATLDLLRFLGRRLAQAKTLMIASYRDDEIGPSHPLRILMGDLATSPSYRRMKLTRLSLDSVRALTADSTVDPLELHRRTSGNPFYVTEVLAAGETGVPSRISDAVLARAARLSAPSREVLDVCSVVGFRFDPRLVTAVVGDDSTTAMAFEEFLSAGVLTADENTVSFRHMLSRGAVLEAVSLPRKRALHLKTLEFMVTAGSTDLSSLAHHAEGADDREAVLRYAPAAARAAVKAKAHREAAAQYERALRFAEGLPAREHAELLEAAALENGWIDRPDRADEAYRQAISLRSEIGDSGAMVEDMVRLSQNLVRQGRNHEGEELASTALALLDSVPRGPVHSFLWANRAYVKMLDRRAEEAVMDGELAIALANEFKDENSLMLAYNAVGSSRIILGDFAKGEQLLLESLHLADRLGSDNHAANAHGNLGSAFGEYYQFAKAEGYLREGIAFCQQRDLDFSRNYIDSWLALVRMFTGAWDEAAELAAELLRRPGGSTITRIMALIALGRVRARRGDPDVWTVLDEALDLAEQTATLQRVGPVRAARAEAAYLAGDDDKAADEATAAYSLAFEHRHPWHLGELRYWQRQAAGAKGSAPGGEIVAGPNAAIAADARHLLAEPYALALAGEWAAAARAWDELGCPYEMARALSEADDQEQLERARATFVSLGAGPALTNVEAKMRALGHRVPRGPAPTTVANPANLTKREAQIVKLLAQGNTNKEIADRLFRSVRTIDHHVSAILAKLEASNRVEAAQKATSLGLLE